MIVVAACAVVAQVVAVTVCGHVIRSLSRQHARERNLLLNQLLHLAGRTWEPPPAAEPPPETFDDYGLIDPSQLPDLQ